MNFALNQRRWGRPPWQVEFEPRDRLLPDGVDFAVIGGGLTGLAAAAWLRRLAPEKSVVVLEATHFGSGASYRTGGIALDGTAAGDLPGLGNVLSGLTSTLQALDVECELALVGAWEIARSKGSPRSPIAWEDSGTLRVVNEVPGGTLDPGKLVSGLARAAERLGVALGQNTPLLDVDFGEPFTLTLPGKQMRAREVLFATNAHMLELSGLADRSYPAFTIATATAPLEKAQIEELGLHSRKPFYTLDLPYLWGRVMANNGLIVGSGLVHTNDWRDLHLIDIASGQSARLLASLEERVRGLHPALRSVEFTHRWGGPILFADGWQPVFAHHPRSRHALVLGAYSGHGVALSIYLGCWAAEVLLGRRELPAWGQGER